MKEPVEYIERKTREGGQGELTILRDNSDGTNAENQIQICSWHPDKNDSEHGMHPDGCMDEPNLVPQQCRGTTPLEEELSGDLA